MSRLLCITIATSIVTLFFTAAPTANKIHSTLRNNDDDDDKGVKRWANEGLIRGGGGGNSKGERGDDEREEGWEGE